MSLALPTVAQEGYPLPAARSGPRIELCSPEVRFESRDTLDGVRHEAVSEVRDLVNETVLGVP